MISRTHGRWAATPRHACAGIAIALCACTTVPPFQTPEVAVPAHWHATPSPTAPSASEPQAWWTTLRSRQLDALIAKAQVDGLELQAARARLEQARGLAQIAAAGRMPSADLGIAATRGSASSGSGTHKQTLALQGGYALDPWGAQAAHASAAEWIAAASLSDLEAVRQALCANIALDYVQVLALDERIRLARRIAADASHLLDLVEKQASLGAASQLDVQQQRNTLQTFLAAVPTLRLQRDTVAGQLAVLVGATPESLVLAPEPLQAVEVPVVQAIAPADAIAARPEVRAAEARLRAANFDIGVARAAFLPGAALTAQAGWMLDPTAALWSVTGSLLQPLFDGGQRAGQLHVDRARAEELVATYKLTLLQALQDTEAQLTAIERLREAEGLDREAVTSAQEALRLARIRYAHGATDLLTVIVDERTLYQAQDTLLQTRLQRLQATVGLYRALGGRAPLVASALPSP